MKKKIAAGLTGGIASGKSMAAEMFRDAGAYIIDTDTVSREVSDGSARAALTEAFPEAFERGELCRRKLREIVFADEKKRQTLNGILHPEIYRETARRISDAAAPLTIVVAPLLFEAGFDSLTSPNITVHCPVSLRIERLMKRDTISERLSKAMIAAQLSDEERAQRADIVLNNDGTAAELRAQVLRVYCELTER